jgi:hypothetical protein
MSTVIRLREIIAQGNAQLQSISEFMDSMRAILAYLQSEANPVRGGSLPGRTANKRRDFHAAWLMWRRQYWGDEHTAPVYTLEDFRRRFRVPRDLFVTIHDAVLIADPKFCTLTDAAGKRGLHSEIKVAVCLRYLGAGIGADQLDDQWEMSKTMINQLVHRFCIAIVSAFKADHLRLPSLQELNDLSRRNGLRGLPGCMGSIDCMHWNWTRCPMARKGMYQGKGGKASVVLEAIADMDLRIWHADFGTPGSVNDITITWRSPMVTAFANGSFPPAGFTYTLQGRTGFRPYFLADGIYPEWPLFLKTIPTPSTPKAKLFVKKQESYRKEVECTFGILRARWHILQRPSLIFSIRRMQTIIYTCIILHNMLVKFQQDRAASVRNPSARRAQILDEMVRFLPETIQEIRQSYNASRQTPQYYREDVIGGRNREVRSAMSQPGRVNDGSPTTPPTLTTFIPEASSPPASIETLEIPSSTEDRAVNAAYPLATPRGVAIAEAFMQSLYDADTGIFSGEGHFRLQRDAMDSVYNHHGNIGEGRDFDPYDVSSQEVTPRSSQESAAEAEEDERRRNFRPRIDSQGSDSADGDYNVDGLDI